MSEWSNELVLKTSVLHGTGGSNPSFTAKETRYAERVGFCVLERLYSESSLSALAIIV